MSDNIARSLEGTKAAVALPHGSESTEESVAGWCTYDFKVRLELWEKYIKSYDKKQK